MSVEPRWSEELAGFASTETLNLNANQTEFVAAEKLL
jgi:hypothetical protein